jgi:hypothetical protein
VQAIWSVRDWSPHFNDAALDFRLLYVYRVRFVSGLTDDRRFLLRHLPLSCARDAPFHALELGTFACLFRQVSTPGQLTFNPPFLRNSSICATLSPVSFATTSGSAAWPAVLRSP